MDETTWIAAYWEEIQDEMKPAIKALHEALKKVPRDLPWSEIDIKIDIDSMGASVCLVYHPPEDEFRKIYNEDWI